MEKQSKGEDGREWAEPAAGFGSAIGVTSMPCLPLTPWKNSLSSDIQEITTDHRSTEWWISTEIYHKELILCRIPILVLVTVPPTAGAVLFKMKFLPRIELGPCTIGLLFWVPSRKRLLCLVALPPIRSSGTTCALRGRRQF